MHLPYNQQNNWLGLKPLPKDDRDFSYVKMFGSIDLNIIPDNFIIAEPLEIKNQGNSDLCVAFALTAVSEDQEGVLLEPAYSFAQIKKIQGAWRLWGADLRTGAKAAIKGFLEQSQSPYNLNDGRNFIADWTNWEPILDAAARKHRKRSYFKIDGYDNRFNAFRSALWSHREQKCSILTGVKWRNSWSNAKDGIILDGGQQSIPHALKIFGQKRINGELYLMGQLSNGKDIGDNGIFYFSEEIVNRDFTYGAYMFIDIDPEEAKKVCWSWWRKTKEYLKELFKSYYA